MDGERVGGWEHYPAPAATFPSLTDTFIRGGQISSLSFLSADEEQIHKDILYTDKPRDTAYVRRTHALTCVC